MANLLDLLSFILMISEDCLVLIVSCRGLGLFSEKKSKFITKERVIISRNYFFYLLKHVIHKTEIIYFFHYYFLSNKYLYAFSWNYNCILTTFLLSFVTTVSFLSKYYSYIFHIVFSYVVISNILFSNFIILRKKKKANLATLIRKGVVMKAFSVWQPKTI